MTLAQSFLYQPFSLYIHLPWCLHKCPYCDFNSHAIEKSNLPQQKYVECLINDLDQAMEALQHRRIHSIFFGGGTPSLFSPDSIGHILSTIRARATLNNECEITLETNPGTFEYQKFAEFKSCGINRLSIGVQSFNEKHLNNLQRIHSSREALCAIEAAHLIGFNNINIDLMFGLPEQSIADAKQDLNIACQQSVDHISYYQLTLEPNTIFYSSPPPLPDSDACWEIQRHALNHLQHAGYQRYEVSAYALPDHQCTHNYNYWCFGDYLGIGAGAHSKVSTSHEIIRNQRTRQPSSYMQAVKCKQHILKQRTLQTSELIFEFMLNHLRLPQGFRKSYFSQSTGLSYATIQLLIELAANDGLLVEDQERVYASERGYRFLDEIVQRFLPEPTCN